MPSDRQPQMRQELPSRPPRGKAASPRKNARFAGAFLFLLGAAFMLVSSPGSDGSGFRSAASSSYSAGFIPRTVHVVTFGPTQPHWAPILNVTRRLASDQGFDVRVWKSEDEARELLLEGRYPPYIMSAWDRFSNSDVDEDISGGDGDGSAGQSLDRKRLVRMADFFRVAVVHAHGGIYLDLDMIPCGGLEDLAGIDEVTSAGASGRRALVSFPFTDGETMQISNGAFAAPPGHPLLTLALDMMAYSPKSHKGKILRNTGPGMMARAVGMFTERREEKKLRDSGVGDRGRQLATIPRVDKGETLLGGPDQWTIFDGNVRLGTFRYSDDDDRGGAVRDWEDHRRSLRAAAMGGGGGRTGLDLWHLGLASWMDEETRIRHGFLSKCEGSENAEKIGPWLEEMCRDGRRPRFNQCGIKADANSEQ